MIGIDEAGRGAWAGPMVVAGCYFTNPPDFAAELRDSKQLPKTKRESLYELIIAFCNTYTVIVSPEEIDDKGLTACLCKAAREIVANLPMDCDVILDGPYNFLKDSPYETRALTKIKADATVPVVMAASIVAKVTRDRLMYSLAKRHPGYGFERHVGYGTQQHRQALKSLGVTTIHRRSFKPVVDYCG